MRDFLEFVSSGSTGKADTEAVLAAAACLDRFTAAFNARDLAGMDAELHFPHVMLSGADCVWWDGPGQHPPSFFSALEATGWAYTQYEEKAPVLTAPDKVHFLVIYTRRDRAGNVLSEHRNLWVVVRGKRKWSIALRSY